MSGKNLKRVYNEIRDLITESSDPRFSGIDRSDTTEILRIINAEDAKAADAVKHEIPHIAEAVDLIVGNVKAGGRIFYFGAGTSGRLGILDAAECPPTFGTDPDMVQGIIAGGRETVFLSAEGAEDLVDEIPEIFSKHDIEPPDTVVGISASYRTPYAKTAVEYARKRKCSTVYIACNPRESIKINVDVLICPVVGPEVVAGSTRMKSALAQKMALTALSTAVMIKLGKLYKNLMVDLLDRSDKLSARSVKIVMTILECDFDTAVSLLKDAKGWVKAALVMGKFSIELSEAKEMIDKYDGHLYKVFGEE